MRNKGVSCAPGGIALKMGLNPFLFPRETQSNFIPICVDAMRQNGDYHEKSNAGLRNPSGGNQDVPSCK